MKFLVKADHVILRRVDKVVDSEEKRDALVAELTKFGYENIEFDTFPDPVDVPPEGYTGTESETYLLLGMYLDYQGRKGYEEHQAKVHREIKRRCI